MATYARRNNYQAAPVQSESGAAFFVGKLNKTHNREQIYSALRSLGKRYNFYINKLDMPYGDKVTKRGNKGYCFVHCRSQKEVDRIVALHYIQLGSQKCEVKAYGGRNMDTSSQATSGFATPSRQQNRETDIKDDLQAALQRKNFSEAPKVEKIATSWAEESENPESYYSESGDEEYDEPKTVREASPLSMESVQVPVDTSSEIEKLFAADNVSSFVQHHLVEASGNGKALEFLRSYFQVYDLMEQTMKSMSQQELHEFAKQYVPALKQHC